MSDDHRQGSLAMLLRTVTAALLVVLVGAELMRAAAEDRPFNPTRTGITWSTERAPVDIEIAGAAAVLPSTQDLVVKPTLRLRLDRAYVNSFLASEAPGFQTVLIGVDLDTELPAALFQAILAGPHFRNDVPGIPELTPEEARRRNVVLSLQSDHLAQMLVRFRKLGLLCRGQPLANELWSYVRLQGANCPKESSHETKYIGAFDDTSWLVINCDNLSRPSWARCATKFQFEGFAAGLNFDQQLLPRWREIVTFAEMFLKSKRYDPSTIR